MDNATTGPSRIVPSIVLEECSKVTLTIPHDGSPQGCQPTSMCSSMARSLFGPGKNGNPLVETENLPTRPKSRQDTPDSRIVCGKHQYSLRCSGREEAWKPSNPQSGSEDLALKDWHAHLNQLEDRREGIFGSSSGFYPFTQHLKSSSFVTRRPLSGSRPSPVSTCPSSPRCVLTTPPQGSTSNVGYGSIKAKQTRSSRVRARISHPLLFLPHFKRVITSSAHALFSNPHGTSY